MLRRPGLVGRLATVLVLALAGALPGMAATPQLSPAVKDATWTSERLNLPDELTITAAGPVEQQVARVLASEMDRLDKIRPKVAERAEGARIELALASSPAGKARLTQWRAGPSGPCAEP